MIRNNFKYFVNKHGSITISRYMGNEEVVIIPSEIDGKKVTTIGERAFWVLESEFIRKIIMPDTIENVGRQAFYGCSNLFSVKLSDNLTEISPGMFRDCTSLEEIFIPPKVEKIKLRAFYNCKNLKRISIPKTTTFFGGIIFGGYSKPVFNIEKNSEAEYHAQRYDFPVEYNYDPLFEQDQISESPKLPLNERIESITDITEKIQELVEENQKLYDELIKTNQMIEKNNEKINILIKNLKSQ